MSAGRSSGPVIDIHTHFFPPITREEAAALDARAAPWLDIRDSEHGITVTCACFSALNTTQHKNVLRVNNTFTNSTIVFCLVSFWCCAILHGTSCNLRSS
ncbi:MAG: hypothetical protein ACEQSK_18260 [Sphingomonadaceae bacterium]